MDGTLTYLDSLARVLRSISSAAFLGLALRFAWVTFSDVKHEWQARDVETRTVPVAEDTTYGPFSNAEVPGSESAHRPDLERLKELAGKRDNGQSELAEPAMKPRRLLVDLGPSRSVVYVNQRKVGATPYGGEIQCTDGEEVLIQVLPPEGAPILQTVICRGDSVSAVTGKR